MDVAEEGLWALCPLLKLPGVEGSEWVYLGLTKFADDLDKKIVGKDAKDLAEKNAVFDGFLDHELGKVGLQQNQGKQELLLSFNGPCSSLQRREVRRGKVRFGCKVGEHVRYLGPHIHYRQSYAPELKLRVHAARRAFFEVGPFWLAKGSQ